jgi:hypothetical protein
MGKCVGTFIGEYPGNAEAIFGLGHSGYSPIHSLRPKMPGDPTLQLILLIWQDAVKTHLPKPSPTDYIEILNTYYFRDPQSGGSLNAWRSCGGFAIYFPTPDVTSRFIYLGWGVGHNTSPETLALIPVIASHTHIIIPDSAGSVTVLAGHQVPSPVHPPPPTPSYILQKSKLVGPTYIKEVSKRLR